MTFGDHVVLVQKSPDGEVRRVNAIVLASAVQPSNVNPHQALKDHRGVLPAGEHLEVIFPRSFAVGVTPKARDLDILFQRAVNVPEWDESAWIGWEPGLAEQRQELITALRRANKRSNDLADEVESLRAQIPPSDDPSVADLDAEAAEAEVKAATSGKVRQIKGK